MESYKEIEQQVLTELYRLAQNPEISSLERGKLIKAKNLIEKGEPLPNVLARLSLTYAELALKPGLSPALKAHRKELMEQRDKFRLSFYEFGFYPVSNYPL